MDLERLWTNKGEFTQIDGARLNSLLSGCMICGAEPIDYPLTDGAIIYIKSPWGEVAALELGVNEEGGLYMQLAKVKSEVSAI